MPRFGLLRKRDFGYWLFAFKLFQLTTRHDCLCGEPLYTFHIHGKKTQNLLLLFSFIISNTVVGQNLVEEFIPSTLEYEILESGKPYGVEEAIGWTIILKEDIDTLSEDELIEFLLTISEGKRFVVLSVYLTPEAYNYDRISDVEKGHLLEYRKNIMSVDIGTHRHQIEWTQEVGKFSPKYLEYTYLPLDKWILNTNQSDKK